MNRLTRETRSPQRTVAEATPLVVADVIRVLEGASAALELRRRDVVDAIVCATVPRGDRTPTVGERVLARLDPDGHAVVLAVLGESARTGAAPRIQTPDGASARVEDGAIVLASATGAPLVRYSEAEGLYISAPEGDVTIEARKGRVVVRAAGDVEIAAAGTATILAERIAESAREIVHTVGRWELKANRIFESATNSYREITELAQLRAGRARHLVKGALQFFAERATLVSDEDTVIDGKHVLLG